MSDQDKLTKDQHVAQSQEALKHVDSILEKMIELGLKPKITMDGNVITIGIDGTRTEIETTPIEEASRAIQDLSAGLTDEQWQEIIDNPNTYDAEGDDDDD